MPIDESRELDNSPHMRRIVQVMLDLRRGSLEGAKILDLGSAHGLYTLESAKRGATALGIEGRPAWVEQANAAKETLSLENARFEVGDVRRLAPERLGKFDVTLCLGLLYHLEAREAFELLAKLYEMTTDFLIIDTQFALSPQSDVEILGHDYSGCLFPEHPPGTSREDMEANLGAALDGSHSFWFTLPSLLNMLGDIGFSSVMQLQWPVDYLLARGEPKVHEDYVTLIAFAGQSVREVHGTQPLPLIRRSENADNMILARGWERVGWENRRDVETTTASDAPRRSLIGRFAAAVRAFQNS
ncbi:MAG: methyltransferase domain-containing protein [Caulobacteraceae bacterium]|nr:methyltransferase domain-containing protein [Caulobacter sp.]